MTDLIERPSSEVAARDERAGAGGEPPKLGGDRYTRYDGRPESRPDQPITRDTITPLDATRAEQRQVQLANPTLHEIIPTQSILGLSQITQER